MLADLPSPDAIDAVLFDAGGVLLLPDPNAGGEYLLPLGCAATADDWRRAHYLSSFVLDQMDAPNWPEVRRAVARAVGVGDHDLDAAVPLIERLVVSTPWIGVDGAESVFRVLHEAGFKTAVVSNAFGTVESELEAAGICSVRRPGVPPVGIVIDSSVVGVSKPDPRIFFLALEALGVEPARAIYVGDMVKTDVRGAQAAGLHPIHMDPFDMCAGDHGHVSGLDQLVEYLTRS